MEVGPAVEAGGTVEAEAVAEAVEAAAEAAEAVEEAAAEAVEEVVAEVRLYNLLTMVVAQSFQDNV